MPDSESKDVSTGTSIWKPLAIVVGYLILTGIILVVSKFRINEKWRRDAVDQGHAEWFIDGHNKAWRWKQPKASTNFKIEKEKGKR